MRRPDRGRARRLTARIAAGLALAAVALLPPAIAQAGPREAHPAASPAPGLQQLDIAAKSTEYDGQNHTYVVAGDVRVSSRGFLVTCDRATIYSAPDESRIDRIVFEGAVVAHRGASTFTGGKVTLFVASQRLVAEGGTRTRLVLQKGTTVNGGRP